MQVSLVQELGGFLGQSMYPALCGRRFLPAETGRGTHNDLWRQAGIIDVARAIGYVEA